MSDDQLRDRPDESIATILKVSDKYVSDSRGPSHSWVQALANITVTLLHARALIPAAPTKEGTLCPDGSWSKHGSRRCCLPMGHTGPHEYVGVAAPTKEDTDG